jgi:hypothetical protein
VSRKMNARPAGRRLIRAGAPRPSAWNHRMSETLKKRPLALLAAGFVLGATLVGAFAAGLISGQSPQVVFPEIPLHASSANGGQALLLCVGQVADGQDAIITLDSLTSELNVWVINQRSGVVTGTWKYNVGSDLELERGKTPDYSIAAGNASFRGGNAAQQLAQMVIYVGEGGTGNVAAYYVPWNTNVGWNGPQIGQTLRLVFKQKARSIAVEGEM